MESEPTRYHDSLAQIARWLSATGTPVVAFGQTVFWDEPMKAVLLGAVRAQSPDLPFVMGIHDVDYFSKLPRRATAANGSDAAFQIVSRNDGSTRELWAAVAELAALFGGETPVQISDFHAANVPFARLARLSSEGEDSFVDRWTAAWGWRAIAYTGDRQVANATLRDASRVQPLAYETKVRALFGTLRQMWQWGLDQTVALLTDETARAMARERERELLALLDDAANLVSSAAGAECPAGEVGNATGGESVTCLYQKLLPCFLRLVAAEEPVGLTLSSSLEFFQFNAESAGLPRFSPARLFLEPATREVCSRIYNRVVEGTGIYPLSRFGEGAIPFDVVAPGWGRATIRIAGSSIYVRSHDDEVGAGKMAEPTVEALAQVIERKFGRGAALVGKALLLPVMLCSEAVMALSETASAYLPSTQQWVREVTSAGIDLPLKPLLRLRYSTLDALRDVDANLALPEHIACALGATSLPAADFGRRWRNALDEQRRLLEWLAQHPAVDDLLDRLEHNVEQPAGTVLTTGCSLGWRETHRRYREVRSALRAHGGRIDEGRARIAQLEKERRELAATIREVEAHSRRLRGAANTERQRREALAQRQAFVGELQRIRQARREVAREIRNEMHAIAQKALREQFVKLQNEAERARLQLARNAILYVRGVQRAHDRPCAWWLPLLDPSGRWFREIARTTEAYLEFWKDA